MKNKPIVGITGDIDNDKFSVKMSYVYAMERAGACCVFLPPSRSVRMIKRITKTIDALLIPGGGDINPVFYGNPPIPPFTKGGKGGLKLISNKRFNFEKALLEEIIPMQKPILGICYGIQFLNVFLGGTLYQDLQKQRTDTLNHKSGHRIKIYTKSKLYYILSRRDVNGALSNSASIKVNSNHHQAIKEPGKGLIVSACSEDNMIEAIELKNHPYFIGVQWHPERIRDSYSRALFRSFVSAI